MARAQPGTDVGRNLLVHYDNLVQLLAEYERSSDASAARMLPTTLAEYIGLFERLGPEDKNPAVLTDIDFILRGQYSDARLFDPSKPASRVRQLLADLSAMIERHYFSTGHFDLRTDQFVFFAEWQQSLPEDERAEYTRIVKTDCTIIMEDKLLAPNYALKAQCLQTLSAILRHLGHHREDAARVIAESNPERPVTPDLLVNLQVFQQEGGQAQDLPLGRGADQAEARDAAIRYWAAADGFLHYLFHKLWGWLSYVDYATADKKDADLARALKRSELCQSWQSFGYHFGLGRCLLESRGVKLSDKAAAADDKAIAGKTLPFALVGRQEVGKSSYFAALVYRAITAARSERSLKPDRNLLAFYERFKKDWLAKERVQTESFHDVGFTTDKGAALATYDFRGEEAAPSTFPEEIQERLLRSRGFLFFLDGQILEDPTAMRETAAFYANVLEWWTRANPDLLHVPVGLVINKIDLLIGRDGLKHLNRSTVIPDNVRPELIEVAGRATGGVGRAIGRTPHDRLSQAILQDVANNRLPALRRHLRQLLDHFGQFLNTALGLSYEYQVFLCSSLAPDEEGRGDDDVLPFGVLQPALWVADAMQGKAIHETLAILEVERSVMKDQFRRVEDARNRLQERWEVVQKNQREAKQLREQIKTSWVFSKQYKGKLATIDADSGGHVKEMNKFYKHVADIAGFEWDASEIADATTLELAWERRDTEVKNYLKESRERYEEIKRLHQDFSGARDKALAKRL